MKHTPPYFTTTVLPRSDLVACEIVSAMSEKFSGALDVKERDEETDVLDHLVDDMGSKPNATDSRNTITIKDVINEFVLMVTKAI